ncbi:MAG: M23 family metallopeptidase, partial [bacterium]
HTFPGKYNFMPQVTANVYRKYCHLSRFADGIRPGAWIGKGQVIGYSGKTGRALEEHAHIEDRVESTEVWNLIADNCRRVACLGDICTPKEVASRDWLPAPTTHPRCLPVVYKRRAPDSEEIKRGAPAPLIALQ